MGYHSIKTLNINNADPIDKMSFSMSEMMNLQGTNGTISACFYVENKNDQEITVSSKLEAGGRHSQDFTSLVPPKSINVIFISWFYPAASFSGSIPQDVTLYVGDQFLPATVLGSFSPTVIQIETIPKHTP